MCACNTPAYIREFPPRPLFSVRGDESNESGFIFIPSHLLVQDNLFFFPSPRRFVVQCLFHIVCYSCRLNIRFSYVPHLIPNYIFPLFFRLGGGECTYNYRVSILISRYRAFRSFRSIKFSPLYRYTKYHSFNYVLVGTRAYTQLIIRRKIPFSLIVNAV